MTPRHLLMAAALIGAAALVIFGDKSPADGDVAEAAERRAPAVAPAVVPSAPTAVAQAPTAAAVAASPGAKPAPVEVQIQRLLPRAELIGESGEDSFGGAGTAFEIGRASCRERVL